MTGRTAIHESPGDRIFNVTNYVLLTSLLLVVLYPLVFVVSASFSNAEAVTAGRVWLWPVEPTLIGYATIFKHRLLLSGFANSILYTSAATTVGVALTMLAAYPLSRPELPCRGLVTWMLFFTLLFSGGLIPGYLVVRDLGLLNSRWAMIIPGSLSVWNIFIARTYFQTTLPPELHEAAQLDGCSEFRYLLRIVLPLSGPIIAVLALFYAIGHWNAYFNALIYLRKQELWPLQLVLRQILVENSINPDIMTDVRSLAYRQHLRELLKYSLMVVATVPLMLVYPFVQKHFVRGIMLGSIKG